jgi:hypothetical protein
LQEANKLENVRLETEKKKASLKHRLVHITTFLPAYKREGGNFEPRGVKAHENLLISI